MTEKYKVALEVFEGPLDLLLYLIKKEELDIYDIPIEKITNQYLEYMDLLKMLDIDIAGEFLIMAATLMYIKSRMLLPDDERKPLEEDDDDPRLELVKQLIEYKKFKEVAGVLRDREEEQSNLYARVTGKEGLPKEEKKLDVNIFDLISAFSHVLNRTDEIALQKMFDDKYTVSDKIARIMDMLTAEKNVKFLDLFDPAASRSEIIVTFLAVLELMRLKKLKAVQGDSFGEILINLVE